MVVFWYAWPVLPISQRPQEKPRHYIPHQLSTHNCIIPYWQPHLHTSMYHIHAQTPFITRMFCSQLSSPIFLRSWTARWIVSILIKFWMKEWFPWVVVSQMTMFLVMKNLTPSLTNKWIAHKLTKTNQTQRPPWPTFHLTLPTHHPAHPSLQYTLL